MALNANRPRGTEVWRGSLARIREFPGSLRALIWPPVCAACGLATGPHGGELCDPCARALAALVGESYCLGCGEARPVELLIDDRCGKCREGTGKLRAFVRVGPYTGPLRSLILQYKSRMTLDRLLGGWMTDAVSRWNIQSEVDVWVPIPSPLLRRLQRGFQPTRLLAREIARRTNRPTADLLSMARHVPKFHHGMTATSRKEAIHGAFRVPMPDDVKGRVIGIVDDVSTTGATLKEARRALVAAGAKGVVAVVLAKTDAMPRAQRGPSPGAMD